MPFLLSEIGETYGQICVPVPGPAGPLSLPWRDADWQWKTRGASPMTFSWVTWQLCLWPAKNAQANKFCIASLKEASTLKRADRACEETWRAYITLYGLLLRASHILLTSCKDAVVWQGSRLKSYTALFLKAFSVEVSLGMFDCRWCLYHRSDSSSDLLRRWDNRCVCLCISSLRRETQSLDIIISAAAINIC